LGIIFSERIEIGIPLHGKQVFFFVIAFLAGRDHIAFLGFAPPDQGNDVVHGKFRGGDVFATVVAVAPIELAFPPLGLP